MIQFVQNLLNKRKISYSDAINRVNLSDNSATSLLLDVHRSIDERISLSLIELAKLISFPSNGGLTEKEMESIKSLVLSDDAKSALRKIIADVAGGVMFDLLCNIDGVSDPYYKNGGWSCLRLVDYEEVIGDKGVDSPLHDKLYETYWDWMKKREKKDWKLDNL